MQRPKAKDAWLSAVPTRERMLTSAAQLFRVHGVDGTALSDIVEHARAPRGSTYHHFPGGKAQLAEEATRRAGALVGSMLSAGLGSGQVVPTLELFLAFFERELVASDFAAGCPIAAGALEGGDQPAARAAAGEAFTSWEATIAAALWQQGVPMQRAQSLATTTIAMIEGALLMAKAQRSVTPLERIADEIVRMADAAIADARP